MHVQQKCSTFWGPPTLPPAPLFGQGARTNFTIGVTDWHALLLQSDVLQTLGGVSDMHAPDGLGWFTSMLKVNARI